MKIHFYLIGALLIGSTSAAFGMLIGTTSSEQTDSSREATYASSSSSASAAASSPATGASTAGQETASIEEVRKQHMALLQRACTLRETGNPNSNELRCLGYQIRHLAKKLANQDPHFKMPKRKPGRESSSRRKSKPTRLFRRRFSLFKYGPLGPSEENSSNHEMPFTSSQDDSIIPRPYDPFGYVFFREIITYLK